ncbi:hypothetical protein RCH09_002545 [Actimicrobium sp. GrIS 1.19]|uniref:hypothetical protein n=1 Tax=Actimicrobium sp. GrIS 1.19 TaxID=3071708 RepID=UPI002DF99144|nr:hypothetical protein [Actimicrobium sp. GrIS 1.19]
MFETRKFIFLSSGQRRFVSVGLAGFLIVAISLLVMTKLRWHDLEIKALSIDLIKFAVTAWGGWGLILLYASSNSFNRIQHETKKFLYEDIPRAFGAALVKQGDALGTSVVQDGFGLKVVSENQNALTFELRNASGFSIHFLCRLNVRDLAILIFLPDAHSANYQKIYETSLSFLEDSGCKVKYMGVFGERWLPENERRMQLHIQRDVGDDFLFDAAKRTYAAQCIYGDLRAFSIRAQRGEARD